MLRDRRNPVGGVKAGFSENSTRTRPKSTRTLPKFLRNRSQFVEIAPPAFTANFHQFSTEVDPHLASSPNSVETPLLRAIPGQIGLARRERWRSVRWRPSCIRSTGRCQTNRFLFKEQSSVVFGIGLRKSMNLGAEEARERQREGPDLVQIQGLRLLYRSPNKDARLERKGNTATM